MRVEADGNVDGRIGQGVYDDAESFVLTGVHGGGKSIFLYVADEAGMSTAWQPRGSVTLP